MKLILSAALAAFAFATVPHADVIFSDSEFSDKDWELIPYIYNNHGDFHAETTAVHSDFGGNPNGYRRIQITILRAGEHSLVFGFHRRVGGLYSPASQGEIDHIDYSESSAIFTGFLTQVTGPALRQNGRVYIHAHDTGGGEDWRTFEARNLCATSFFYLDASSTNALAGTDNTQHPDFTANGAPIEIGFFRAQATPDYSSEVVGLESIPGGIDNWSFAIRTAGVTPHCELAQQAYLKASNTGAGDLFAYMVAISGDTLVVGAPVESSDATGVNGSQTNNRARQSGAAYVFVREAGNWRQQAYLKASNPGIEDSFGVSVAVSGDTIVVGAFGEDSNTTGINGNESNNSATDSGAAYVFVRDGTNWSQQAYLKASNTAAADNFGNAVAVSGDTILVGALGEDSNATGVNGNQANNSAGWSGAAYVFVRNGTNWSQQAYLKASNTGGPSSSSDLIFGDQFGWAVALSRDTLVVGAKTEDSNATGVNGDQTNNKAQNSGAAYVFARNGTNWSQQAYLKASNTGGPSPGDDEGDGDGFGNAVAISGDTIVVTAPGEDSIATGVNGDQVDNSVINPGAAYVFVRNGTNWSQQAYLKASIPLVPPFGGEFGQSVGISGDTIAVATGGDSSNATGINGDPTKHSAFLSGAAFVFIRNGTNWSQQAYLKASNTGVRDEFGLSVAVSGDTVVVGSRGEDSNATGVNGNQNDNSFADSGAAYVFTGLGPLAPEIGVEQYQGSVHVFWPLTATSFVLEEADEISTSPGAWTQVPFPYQTNAVEISITPSQAAGNKFYRLGTIDARSAVSSRAITTLTGSARSMSTRGVCSARVVVGTEK